MAHRRKQKDEKKEETKLGDLPDMNQLVSAGRSEYLAGQSAMASQSYDKAIEPYLRVINALMHALNEEKRKNQPNPVAKKSVIKA